MITHIDIKQVCKGNIHQFSRLTWDESRPFLSIATTLPDKFEPASTQDALALIRFCKAWIKAKEGKGEREND